MVLGFGRSSSSQSLGECSFHKLVRKMRALVQPHNRRLLNVCLIYTLLQALLPGAHSITSSSASSASAHHISRYTVECARRCAQSDLQVYKDDILRCIIDCCLVSRNLINTSPDKDLSLVDHFSPEHDHANCRDQFRVQYERETERMRVLIPQKRRWGNTIAPCISSHCAGLVGERRVRCIIQRCNLSPH